MPGQALLPVDEGTTPYGSFEAVAAVAERTGLALRGAGQRPVALAAVAHHGRRRRPGATTSPTKRGPVVQTRETQLRYIVRETGALIYYHLTARLVGPASPTPGSG